MRPDAALVGRPDSHARSSRSWRRARPATSRGSDERFCISASVCSTESCRCAAISARSCERMRSARSVDRERTSRMIQGAKITASTTTTTITASTTSRAALSEPVACRNTSPAAITSAMPSPMRETTAALRSARSSSDAPARVPAVWGPAPWSPIDATAGRRRPRSGPRARRPRRGTRRRARAAPACPRAAAARRRARPRRSPVHLAGKARGRHQSCRPAGITSQPSA